MNDTVNLEKYAFVYSVEFDKQLERLIGDMPRADQFAQGVEWALCRGPEMGKIVVGAPYFVRVVLCTLLGYADVAVYYTVRGEQVHLLTIHDNYTED